MENVEYDISKKWVRADSIEKYTESVISQCIELIKQDSLSCAYTTYDKDLVECVLNKSIENIKKNFNLK